jgi:hypothetical protein
MKNGSILDNKSGETKKEEKEEKEEPTYNNQDNVSAYDSNVSMKPAEWSVGNETILVEWCDIAQCYKWLNYQSYLKYSVLQAWFTIPVIIMSTITGTASFAQSSFTPNQQFYVQFGIGTVNIFIGILTTISQYLKISQLTESHRVSSISWDKYARNIRIELAKTPEERMDAAHFMKISRHEFDRLMETSPMIQYDIVEEFKHHFKGEEGSEQNRLYVELHKPDICDTITSANIYRNRWFDQPKHEITKHEIKLQFPVTKTPNTNNPNINTQQLFKENIFTIAKKMKRNKEKIEKYIITFNDLYGRNPLKSEVIDYFNNSIDKISLERYFESSKVLEDSNV